MKASSKRPVLRADAPAAASPAGSASWSETAHSNAGFTLIEVLVTSLIVILIASATATALITTSHASGDQRLRSQADAIASQDAERLRGLSDAQLNSLNQSRTLATDGTTFSVSSASVYLDTTGTSSCTATSSAYYRVTSTVSWTEGYRNRSDTSVTQQSILSRPVTGDMFVQMTDQTGQALSGVSVGATGPNTQSGISDSNGCVLFAGLSAGSYAVTFADSGYVDPNGNASPPNVTASVTASSPISPSGNPFRLGLAGSLAASFTTVTSGSYGEADAISWLGGGTSYGMSGGYRTATSAAPVGTLTTGSLFPFSGTSGYSGNYAVWPGRCLQQEPPAADDRFSVTPGSTSQAQNVIEPALYLGAINDTTGSTTTAVKPAHVKLTFTSTAGASCSYSWSPTLAAATTVPYTGWLAYPGQPFASTATSGPTASASNATSAEAGQLTVCADYDDYKSSVTATNDDFTTNGNVVPTITIVNGTNAGTC